MRGKLMLTLLILISATLLGCTQMSAEDIAKKVEEKYNAIKDFKGTVKVTVESFGERHVAEYDYVFKKPNKVWMHDKKNGILIVSNGEKMWMFNEKTNEVFLMNVGKYEQTSLNHTKFNYGEFVEGMLEYFNVRLLGSEKIDGRDCYVIQLTPKNEKANATIKMWIDKEYWYPLKMESCMNNAKTTIEYLNVKFNTGVSDDLFNFKPPKGAKVVTEEDMGIKDFKSIEEAQKHVDFKILKPKYTAGYELKDVKIMFKSVSLTYTKDGEILVITETKGKVLPSIPNAKKVKVGDCEGLYVEMYGSKVLTFSKDNVIVSITGKIDKDELVKIAESME